MGSAPSGRRLQAEVVALSAGAPVREGESAGAACRLRWQLRCARWITRIITKLGGDVRYRTRKCTNIMKSSTHNIF